MSLVQTMMFSDQLNTHFRSRSFELIKEAKTARINKRSFSDDLNSNNSSSTKRSRTAPPSPPYDSKSKLIISNFIKPKLNHQIRSKSLSPNKKFTLLSPSNSTQSSPNTSPKIQLPSITATLNTTTGATTTTTTAGTTTKTTEKPVIPTVSLDYFDTYKPNDENWRYELLDKITKESKHFHLNQYNYLNKLNDNKPNFDSKISTKIQYTSPVKIKNDNKQLNFPFESNYTYLNQTYMKDVKNYPEYLELAQSLIKLSDSKIQPRSSSNDSNIQHIHHHPQQQPQHLPSMHQFPPPPQQTQSQQHHPIYNTSLPSVGSSFYQHNNNQTVLPSISQTLPNIQQFSTSISSNSSTSSSLIYNYQNSPQTHKFIPISPIQNSSNLKIKSRSELIKSPPPQTTNKSSSHSHTSRTCISCGSDQSPCWRPSWSIKQGQLCNSCGLRYKKTSARCLNDLCKKIPAKGEWSLMQSKGKVLFEDGMKGFSCLDCGWRVEVNNEHLH
ncbi:ASH1 [Candida pseudojiufengensis]|uniref:ASH1 n=1 Tax=Candida pseudojiufengensis TaxID=497109 RepID=UPI002224C828|nr:ASH1 [Candida pseudojiufengensis]KAI5960093.1 ASH1 [Candida pseudojiufengensis]